MHINHEFNPEAIQGAQQETVCIKVPKVFDWVTRQVDVPLISQRGLLTEVFPGCTLPTGITTQDVAKFGTVECFLSDEFGKPLDPLDEGSICCVEITQPGGRQDVQVTLPTGEVVTLQKVKVLKKGFVTVVLKVLPTVCEKPIICCVTKPFQVAEKFFLCAPPGTFLQCHITDFECDAQLIFFPCTGTNGTDEFQLDISINMCQDIQMEAMVKLEILADFCQPRPELPFECPPRPFPPQCPTVFPG
ncbi:MULTISPECIES: hypothetical protein [Aneurinibacillus]|uniref:Uncharacterized protein n=1 Tax=Aneurinibacillus thermoaerophilus TaxID=143495 RepID=A0A1G7X974_ANETH|nr:MULTISPECIES: hypothetical protein [Aneurinibacillus]AMA73265.1 hypothetical protein ACH33_10615 [Aneurinibacillus sp. XH2]MED0674302.1 hypothetical protein [Aneurinibacillus thermoaerophilus]MED0678320.1 hypothetical protein [Aneurinibacillus thermoaerophilus]MED0736154.1 hypothetical protein [Aneurinibacillus thermoaerophilus]MED0757000.1 hypothetical protein [Aneurinibacillus thermoaerophilus]